MYLVLEKHTNSLGKVRSFIIAPSDSKIKSFNSVEEAEVAIKSLEKRNELVYIEGEKSEYEIVDESKLENKCIDTLPEGYDKTAEIPERIIKILENRKAFEDITPFGTNCYRKSYCERGIRFVAEYHVNEEIDQYFSKEPDKLENPFYFVVPERSNVELINHFYAKSIMIEYNADFFDIEEYCFSGKFEYIERHGIYFIFFQDLLDEIFK